MIFFIETCFKDRDYEHGDEHITGCNNCTCNDGNFLCGSIACPTLSCPPEEQISVANECCKYCKGNGRLGLTLNFYHFYYFFVCVFLR